MAGSQGLKQNSINADGTLRSYVLDEQRGVTDVTNDLLKKGLRTLGGRDLTPSLGPLRS